MKTQFHVQNIYKRGEREPIRHMERIFDTMDEARAYIKTLDKEETLRVIILEEIEIIEF